MKFNKIKIYFLILLTLVNGMIFYTVFAESRNNVLKIAFLDIGQGDAIFIESPSGNQILIDAGPSKIILNALARVMPFYDRTIDVVLATHPDSDHIGGIPEVFKSYSVDNYIYNGATGTTGVSRELIKIIIDKNIKTYITRTGEIIDIGGGAYLNILYPDRDPEGKDTNSYSVVTQLIYGNTKILLTGDISTDVEEKLIGIYNEELDSDILKVAHHGSKNSLSVDFLEEVTPKYSIISAGKDNRYGHPHKEIINSLKNIKNNIILGTYDSGDIIFTSDGQNLVIQ